MKDLRHWRVRPAVLWYIVLLILSGVAGVLVHMVPSAAGEEDAQKLPLVHVADIPLPGRTTRLDYESNDPARHLLFIAHLGDGEVIAFDAGASRVIARIADVASVHGVLVIPEMSRVYASATGTDEVVAIDEATLRIIARMPGGHYPDGMAYAPEVHKLYLSDENGNTETVIDVRDNKRVATIALGGEVGNTQYDPQSRHIFVNVQTRNELVEIDPTSDRIVGRLKLAGADHNHGLLIDSRDGLAFIACQGNDHLLVFDMQARRVIQSFGIGGDPDVLAFDPAPGTLYVAGEAGVVSMFSVRGSNVAKTGEGNLGPNAHVVAVDPTTHHSYFPLKNVDGRPALRIMSAQ